MDARLRITFFCGICLGLALGMAAGQAWVWNRADFAHVAFHDRIDSGYPATPQIGGSTLPITIPAEGRSELTRIPSPGGAVVLNDPDSGDEPIHADALIEVPSSTSIPSEPVSPATLPSILPVEQAQSIADSTSSAPDRPQPESCRTQQAQATSPEASPRAASVPLDPEVVKMLKEELEGVSEQQREIWADALQGMSPADAAGIIVMWKKFGQANSGPDHLSAPPPLFRSSHPDAAPTPLQQSAPGQLLPLIPETGSPNREEELGARIAQHNEANRETCGYLEMIPVLKEVAFDPTNTTNHTQIVGFRLDIEPGRHVETGNPSHVSLQRGCFFAVKLPTGEEHYTRVGRLVLDAERRLCIDLGDRDLPITPELKLPEGTTRFHVQNGQLRVEVTGQEDPVEVGPLQVAEFFDASRLQPLGGSVYNATTASGKPNMVAAEPISQTLEYPSIEKHSTMAGR